MRKGYEIRSWPSRGSYPWDENAYQYEVWTAPGRDSRERPERIAETLSNNTPDAIREWARGKALEHATDTHNRNNPTRTRIYVEVA